MKINRFLPLIIPFLTFLVFQSVFFNPASLYMAFVFIFLFSLFSARELVLASSMNEKWYNIVLLPLYLGFSALAMSILIPVDTDFGVFIIQVLYLLVTVMYYYYYKYIYYYLINQSKYRINSLEFFSSYANFFSAYLLSSVIFGFQSFLNISTWVLLLIMTLAVFALSYQTIWVNRQKNAMAYFYISFVCLCIFELSWAVSFLSLSFYVSGLLIAISYYVLIGLVRFHLLKIINKSIIKTYLSLGFISIFVVLLSARWI